MIQRRRQQRQEGHCLGIIRFSTILILQAKFFFQPAQSFMIKSLLRNQVFPRLLPILRMTSTVTNNNNSQLDEALRGQIEIPLELAMEHHGNLKFLDGSWWLGPRETTSRQDFERGPRITGAHFYDIDDICSPPGTPGNPGNLPHMMPPPEIAAACMKAFGINSTKDHIVVYGQDKCPFLHRAWFQIGCMGHDFDRVHLLAGSLKDWMAAGGPVDTTPIKAIRVADLHPAASDGYTAVPARNVVDLETVRRLVATRDDADDDAILIDARSPDRFYGRVDEPRPGLMRGHMPGAKNVFFMDLLQPDIPNRLKPRQELQRILQDALGQDVWTSTKSSFIATCGSGATACTVAAALIACGIDPERVKIYDGSWCEWGSDTNNPVVTTEND